MYKTFCLFLLLLVLFKTAKSQHCGWDNCYVIILDVRDSLTNKIINDLDILLTDSSGKPYRSKWNSDNFKETSVYQNTDTLKFGQNKGNSYPNDDYYSIPFGVNNYMLLVYASNYPDFNENGKDKIWIKDKKGRYDNLSLTFDKTKIAHMCISSPIRRNKDKLDAVTIKIKIKEKKT